MIDTRMKIRFLKNGQSGFTLIELTVVIIILGLVMGIAYGVILLNARTFKYLSDTIVTRWDMRKAMDIIRSDLQELNAENIFAPTFHGHSGSKLYFRTIDGKKVMYSYVNKELMRLTLGSGGGGWTTLLNNLQSPPFRFLDRNMQPSTDIHKIAYIKVNLIVKNTGQQNPITLENLFYLRNTAPLAPK